MDGETVLREGFRNGSKEAAILGGRRVVHSLKEAVLLLWIIKREASIAKRSTDIEDYLVSIVKRRHMVAPLNY